MFHSTACHHKRFGPDAQNFLGFEAITAFRYHGRVMTKLTKTRFAPSPTGELHLGNVRTALFNWLYAGSQQGVFILRIEDTDVDRSEKRHEQALIADLHWLDVHWQEGPGCDGDNGPYHQSARQDIYQRHYQHLQDKDLMYPCFCSPQQLSLSRKAQLASGRPPRYAGTCAGLSKEEIDTKLQNGEQPAWRFRVPTGGDVQFDDRVRGAQKFNCADIGDFIIRRSNGGAAFFFCNAVDDALMGVTHVLRGEDHLSNTPRQMMILQALELPVPQYGHTAMIVDDKGAPLSKRSGSRSIRSLRESGYFSAAVVNYMARLGHQYSSNDFLSSEALQNGFSLGSLGRAPARFDPVQLDHWQKLALEQADTDTLWQWCSEYPDDQQRSISQRVPDTQRHDFINAVRDNCLFPADVSHWVQVVYDELPPFNEDAAEVIAAAGSEFYQAALNILSPEESEPVPTDFRAFAGAVGKAAGVKGKQLFMPLRAAISGQTSGPEMARLWPLLGTARIVARLQHALKQQ